MKQRYPRLLSALYYTFLFILGSPSVIKAQIQGKVFRDINASGAFDSTTIYKEVGLAGITVTAYNATGTSVGTTTTNSTGNYTIPSVLGAVRIEFTGLASTDYSGPKGIGSNTSIQFVTAPITSVNYGVNDPDWYWDNTKDPRYVLPCYVNGTASGTGGTDPAIVSIPYSSTGLNSTYKNEDGVQGTGPVPRMDGTIAQVGTVWGEAYHKTQKHLYFSTFLKRHSGMADGPGYIYNFDYSGTTPSLTGKFNLQGVVPNNGGAAINLGSVTRTGSSDYTLPSDKLAPSVDLDAFGKIGTMSFGDIDIQPGTDYLWAVNLFQKALIRVDVSGNPTSTPAGVEQYVFSTLSGYPTSTTGVLRPFALAFNRGKGYLGVINDASISGLAADLKAYVLEFDPNNMSAGFTEKLNFDPNYKRVPTGGTYLLYKSWMTTYSEPPVIIDGSFRVYSQPVLSDIEFDEKGNMYLSFLDRWGHQLGYFNYKPLSGSTNNVEAYTHGALLKACSTATGWVMEGTGTCLPAVTEFFEVKAGDNSRESAEGAVALLKGRGQILQVSIDPHPTGTTGSAYWFTQGANTLSLTTGLIENWYSVYYSTTDALLYGKANGLGDVEFITDPAPLEIGNRVWNDTNSNGKQDAGEAGIDGVTVLLFEGATQVGTTTTANGGQYYFTNTNVTGGLKYSTSYEIRIATSQAPLSTLSLTTTDVGTNGSDLIDNDGTVSGANAIKAFTTGLAGQNNHSYDFGFMPAPLCIAPTITSVSSDTATCTNGITNSDAAVHVTGITGMEKYAYGTNGATGLYAANATASTTSSINITGLPAPSIPTTYTFRLWGVDTTCYNDTTVVLTPSVCPQCSITGTFTQNACNNNGTTSTGTDDYFTISVSAVSATNGGASGKYEVVLNGTVLNTGGTAYGTSVTVGTTTTFKSDGTTTYSLAIRDLNIPTCVTTLFTTTASPSCSVIPCPTQVCIPITVSRNN